MRLHRFFIPSPLSAGSHVVITDENVIHQWRSVFRFKTGNQVIVFDNSGFDYTALITDLRKNEAEIEILEQKENKIKFPKEIYLFASLIKKDNYEWILEKCTELGVSHFVPIITARTEKKDLNMDRALKIITEASEQSGRGTIPVLYSPMGIGDAYEAFVGEKIQHIVFDGSGEQFDSAKFENKKIGVWIGPEGGWSEEELSAFKQLDISIVKFGSGQTLRAETAAIATSSMFLL